jgi:hypothetical protein
MRALARLVDGGRGASLRKEADAILRRLGVVALAEPGEPR